MKYGKSSLRDCPIAIELLSGEKIFGKVSKWSSKTIYVTKEGYDKPIDVPRDIIVRTLILLSD
jgi:hypothetical protein